MLELLTETTNAANALFKGQPIIIWYAKLGPKSWRCFVINKSNKIKLAVGPVRTTPAASLMVVKDQLENLINTTKTINT